MDDSLKPVVLFGTGDFSRRVRYYVETWTRRRVVALTVHAEFRDASTIDDLPVVPFEEVADRFPAEEHAFFSCVGYRDHNHGRARTFGLAERLGYDMISLVSPDARINNARLGAGTIVCEGAILGPFSEIGRGVMVSSMAHVSHDTHVGDFCYLSSGSCVAGRCVIGSRTMIGVGATVRDHIEIAADCLVGAGAVVVRPVTQPGIYFGNPARFTGPWK